MERSVAIINLAVIDDLWMNLHDYLYTTVCVCACACACYLLWKQSSSTQRILPATKFHHASVNVYVYTYMCNSYMHGNVSLISTCIRRMLSIVGEWDRVHAQ